MLMPQPTPTNESVSKVWLDSAMGLSLISCLLLWAAFPPLGWSLLAWVAPLAWLRVIDREKAPGKAGYFAIWVTGSLFWLAILHGIRLAYWPLIFGWIALSLYLGIYVALFVGVARILRHRWRWSLSWAAPVAWTGWELVRSYMLTGYAANTLAHSQYQHPLVIQLADQIGGYGVSLIMMAVAVGLYRFGEVALARRVPASRWDLVVPAGLLFVLLGYGAWRLAEGEQLATDAPPLLRVALIQENTPSVFDSNLERLYHAWNRYAATTADAIRVHGVPDLIVWPESTFTAGPGTTLMATVPWMEDRTTDRVPPEVASQNVDRTVLRDWIERNRHDYRTKVATLHQVILSSSLKSMRSISTGTSDEAAQAALPYYLMGDDAVIFEDDRVVRHNAAMLLDPQGQIAGRYDKIHLVMFGEYIPLNWALSFLGDAFGFSSATPGIEVKSFEVDGVRIAPSICFESMLPQFMSWQMRSLVAQQKAPDVLITITNDSWFRGSTLLDHHLACEVFAAVEMRRPFLVAANTGLSAWIEGTGRIKHLSPRLDDYHILAEPTRDSRWGLTQVWGDLPAWCLAGICGLALFSAAGGRRRRRRAE